MTLLLMQVILLDQWHPKNPNGIANHYLLRYVLGYYKLQFKVFSTRIFLILEIFSLANYTF